MIENTNGCYIVIDETYHQYEYKYSKYIEIYNVYNGREQLINW